MKISHSTPILFSPPSFSLSLCFFFNFTKISNWFAGVQFHPESICTTFGDEIIRNFLGICHKEREKMPSILPQNSSSVKKDALTKTNRSKGILQLKCQKRPWKSTECDLSKVMQGVWRTSVVGKTQWALNDQSATEDSFWLDTATTAEVDSLFFLSFSLI